MTSPRRRLLAAIGFVAACATGVLVIYLALPALEGFRFPIGPDGPVYTWLARLAGYAGFVDAPGGGPGVPALTLTLGRLLGTEPVQAVMLLGPVLATVTGLAAGALLEVTLGEDRLRTAAAIVMTGAFAAYLAGGWLANLAMVAIFLLAVAALSESSLRSMWNGGALLLAAGLAHRIFVVIGGAILLGAAAWQLIETRRGRRNEAVPALRLGAAAIAGPAAALLLGAWIGTGPRVPGDTSQDGFFRRTGLRDLLLDRYRERFVDDTARAAIPVATGLGLSLPWTLARSGSEGHRDFLRDVLASWAVLSGAGILLLAATGWGPPYRIIQFAFFLPLAAAAGAAILVRKSRLRASIGTAAVIAFVAVAMVGWFRQSPAFSADDVTAAARAGAAASSLPAGTPLVFLVDTDEEAAAYHVTRAANLIRMAVPPGRIMDVRVVVGQPHDLLAGDPTITGDAEHDELSRTYLREAAPLLDRAAILVIRRFNAGGFEEPLRLGDPIADGVFALTRSEEMDSGAGAHVTAPAELGLAALFLLSLGSLGLLGLLGFGWARWILPRTGFRGIALGAPSAGAAVVILATVAADRFGSVPGTTGSIIAVVSFGAAGHLLAARRGR